MIMLINGSLRPNGNTETLFDEMIRGIEDAGNAAVKFNLREMDIKPCLGCFACMKGNGCIQKDDMQRILQAYEEADVIVFGSPLQWMQVTGPMKTMLDRLLTAVAQKKETKDAFLVMTAGAPEEIFHDADVVKFYQGFVKSMGWNDTGKLLAGGVGGPGYPVDVKDTEYIELAYEAGRNM